LTSCVFDIEQSIEIRKKWSFDFLKKGIGAKESNIRNVSIFFKCFIEVNKVFL